MPWMWRGPTRCHHRRGRTSVDQRSTTVPLASTVTTAICSTWSRPGRSPDVSTSTTANTGSRSAPWVVAILPNLAGGCHGEFAWTSSRARHSSVGDLLGRRRWWSRPSTGRRAGAGSVASVARVDAGDRRCGDAVGGDAVEGDGAVGAPQRDPSSGVQLECPATFVDEVVVSFTEWHKIVEVGSAESFPVGDVMDPAVFEADGAVGVATGAVHRS